MSVVVPPISTTTASLMPVMAMAPIMLAAGPDMTVSTGLRRAMDSPISEPLPRTTSNGASTSSSAMTSLTESMRLLITGMSPASITHVEPRTWNPRLDESS